MNAAISDNRKVQKTHTLHRDTFFVHASRLSGQLVLYALFSLQLENTRQQLPKLY